VKLINAYIYHYGWVRNPLTMHRKNEGFYTLWDGEAGKDKKFTDAEFDYSNIDSVTLFEGTHPAAMQQLVNSENWESGIDLKKKNFKNIKHRLLYFLWKHFGWRPFEYRNYIRV
jgi:hypothetical protein